MRKKNSLTIRLKRNILKITFSLIIFTAYFGQFVFILPEENEINKVFTLVMETTYENMNSGSLVWNMTQNDRTIGLFMNNTWQTVRLTFSSSSILKLENDEDGNPIAFMNFPTIVEPGANFSFKIAYEITLKQRSIPDISEGNSKSVSAIPEDLKESYLGSEGPWQADDPNLIQKANELIGNETNVLSIIKKFIIWIKENISYKTFEGPIYPNETLLGKKGDCDDQANLFITFCRIVGIPAFLQIGCIYLPQRDTSSAYWENHYYNKLTNIGWHGWAVVFIPPWGWFPVDLTYTSGNLINEPLNAIKTSAIIKQPTFQFLNITKRDYIYESRQMRFLLISNGFRVYENENMQEENF
jgi:hypothetical protein